jgi:hypothetical protein
MNVEKKQPRSEETIYFSKKDRGNMEGPHDDAICLPLKNLKDKAAEQSRININY